MQLLGLTTFRFLEVIYGLPDLIEYDFHPYELGKTASYSSLPLFEKIGYFRSQKLYEDPITVFEAFVKHVLLKGYRPSYLIDVYNSQLRNARSFSFSDQIASDL